MLHGNRSPFRMSRSLNSSFSIRARLLLLAALAVAPLLFDRIRLLEANRIERIETAYDQAMGLARQAAQAQHEMVIAARAVLQVVSRTWAAAKSGETCDRLFPDIMLHVPWLKGLTVVGLDGRIVCSTFPNAAGLDLSDRDYVQAAVRTGEFVLSEYLIGRMQNGPTLVAAVPTHGPDQTINGLINAAIDLRWIDWLSGGINEHPGAMAVLIDRQGTLLAGRPEVAGTSGLPLSDRLLTENMLAHPEGRITTTGLDGVRRMFAFTRVPGTEAHVAVGLDEAEVLDGPNRKMWIAYLWLLAVCGCALFGIWLGGERMIIQPIRLLSRSATRIGRGNLETPLTNRSWAPEFAPLAAALENMSHELGVREKQLRCANTHLEELSRIDGLSGLANRRGFDISLDAEWRSAVSQRRSIGLIMIDVDHFKLFNDNHGHVEGDECLRAVGAVIASVAVGGPYFAARYGGEEFALLLAGVDIEKAVEMAERLRCAVAGLRIVNAGAPSGHLTISVGVAALAPQPEQRAQVLVEAADGALYAAKRVGRNTVVACPAPSLVPSS